MNKVILMGRLTKAPEIKFLQDDNKTAMARYTMIFWKIYRNALLSNWHRNIVEYNYNWIHWKMNTLKNEYTEKWIHWKMEELHEST